MRHDQREQLAALMHEQWSGWMKYLFGKCRRVSGGGMYIPVELMERWQRQMNTPYSKLSSGEKNSDRAEADRILKLLKRINHEISESGNG